jgi:hypothetical protein
VSVYVDGAQNAFGRMKMCHMIADSVAELFAMADAIGVARRWYQQVPAVSFPHFDICQSKRALAVKAGAIEVDRYQLVAKMRELRPWIRGKDWVLPK